MLLACRLPEVHINEKTDMFRVEGQTFSSFRLLARAVTCDADGQAVLLQHIAPALSSEFTVSHHVERDEGRCGISW